MLSFWPKILLIEIKQRSYSHAVYFIQVMRPVTGSPIWVSNRRLYVNLPISGGSAPSRG